MEALKAFENLPEAEKIQLFKILSLLGTGNSSTSTEESSSSTVKGESLKDGAIQCPEPPTSSESKSKQKTLDGWLIKKNKGPFCAGQKCTDVDSTDNGESASSSSFHTPSTDQSPFSELSDKSSKETAIDTIVPAHEDELMKDISAAVSPSASESFNNCPRPKLKNVKNSLIDCPSSSKKTKAYDEVKSSSALKKSKYDSKSKKVKKNSFQSSSGGLSVNTEKEHCNSLNTLSIHPLNEQNNVSAQTTAVNQSTALKKKKYDAKPKRVRKNSFQGSAGGLSVNTEKDHCNSLTTMNIDQLNEQNNTSAQTTAVNQSTALKKKKYNAKPKRVRKNSFQGSSGGLSVNTEKDHCNSLTTMNIDQLNKQNNASTYTTAVNQCTALKKTKYDAKSLRVEDNSFQGSPGGLSVNAEENHCNSLTTLNIDPLNKQNNTSAHATAVNQCTALKKVKLHSKSENLRVSNFQDLSAANSSQDLSCKFLSVILEDDPSTFNVEIPDNQNNSSVNDVQFDNKKPYNLREKRKLAKVHSLNETKNLISKKCKNFDDTQNHTDTDPVLNINNNTISLDEKTADDQSEMQQSMESDYEAFIKIEKQCTQYGLDISDVILHENIQKVLNNHSDNYSNAIFLIGSHKSDFDKVVPVVHMHLDKFKLNEQLLKLQKNLSTT